MTKRRMIVKVQIPIETNMADPKALVYDKDRSCEGMVAITDEVKDIMAGSVKEFFHAEIDDDGAVYIMEVAPWQTW